MLLYSGGHLTLDDHDPLPNEDTPVDETAPHRFPATEFIVIGLNNDHQNRLKDEQLQQHNG